MLTGGYSRVTNSMMTNTFIRDIQRNLSSIATLQHQIATGKKIDKPSDDPVGADRALDYRQALRQADQYSSNVDDADSLASNVDGVLNQMESILMRIRDLAVRGSNESPENQSDRDAMANEIDSLVDEMIHDANRKFDNRYLFGGLRDNVIPFTAKKSVDFVYDGAQIVGDGATATVLNMPTYTMDGTTRTSQAITDQNSVTAIIINGKNLETDMGGTFSVDPATDTITITLAGGTSLNATDKVEVKFDKTVAVVYNGDMGTRDIEISDMSRIGTTYAGAVSSESSKNSLFGKFSAEGSEMASVEAFQKLLDLRDSLYKHTEIYPDGNNNMTSDIMRGIDDVDSIRSNITNIRAEQGGRVNRLELAKNRLENMKIYTQEMLSNREDVDMAQAISEFTLRQNVYQAALGAGAQIIQTTLLNFLR